MARTLFLIGDPDRVPDPLGHIVAGPVRKQSLIGAFGVGIGKKAFLNQCSMERHPASRRAGLDALPIKPDRYVPNVLNLVDVLAACRSHLANPCTREGAQP